MPTTRPRHVLTETDDLAAVLDDAAQRWPEDAGNRRRLLLHLIDAGHKAIDQTNERRRQAILRTSGDLTGVYGPDYLKQLRGDWPA